MEHWRDVMLEVSFKAFLRKDNPGAEAVAKTIFEQYRELWSNAENIRILLWVGDGSEILEFREDAEFEFDWCRYTGIISALPNPELEAADPEGRYAFTGKEFEADTQPCTIAFLRSVIDTLKRIGKAVSGREILVGDAFDPGPEFTISEFKTKHHPECCRGSYGEGLRKIVSCAAKLNRDDRPYAAFPNGIPDGISFGKFLGRQLNAFRKAVGLDFIWFSNGFGFGNHPWMLEGDLFDGRRFDVARAETVSREILEFWHDFRAECDIPLRVRGTNFGTGIDLAGDAVPLREIYRNAALEAPPVNSPWAAINRDIGMELSGWMAHLAGWSGPDFLFRFYLHDPWFHSSPWQDRYEREPYDIYLPLAVAKLRGGKLAESARSVSILTVDNCRGELPPDCPGEVIPHLNRARSQAPDEAGPLVWVYPFGACNDGNGKSPEKAEKNLFGDLFIRAAINCGLPLNTVVAAEESDALPPHRVAVSPVPEPDSEWESRLLEYAEQGGAVLLYGPLDAGGRRLNRLLGIEPGEPLAGEFRLETLPPITEPAGTFRHEPVVSGGGLAETGGNRILARAVRGEVQRTFAAEAEYGAGRIVWLRGSLEKYHPYYLDEFSFEGNTPQPYECASLAVSLLKRFGWEIEYRRADRVCRPPVMTIHYHRNAMYFTGCNFSTPTEQVLSTPWGAPVPTGCDAEIGNGKACCRHPRSWCRECRIFVRQQAESTLFCRESDSPIRGQERYFKLYNLKDAELGLMVPDGAEERVELRPFARKNPLFVPVEPYDVVFEHGRKICRFRKKLTGNFTIGY